MRYRKGLGLLAAVLFVAAAAPVAAQSACDAACQAARKAQDPLADVKGIMTDNTISFGTSRDQTAYSFGIQPVYSIKTDLGFNFIARGVIPIVGVPRGAGLPQLFNGRAPKTEWGLSDTVLQGFIVPKVGGDIKFGFGPQVSLRTRTSSTTAGPGWGGGMAAVFFGFAGDFAYGGIVGHLWGQNGFSLTTVQPIVTYNMKLFGGSYVGYNNSITYNWNAAAGSRWQVPVGLTFGKTIAFSGGEALDLSIGTYYLPIRPSGGADWQLKFGISLLF